jgi:hypothetical protein
MKLLRDLKHWLPRFLKQFFSERFTRLVLTSENHQLGVSFVPRFLEHTHLIRFKAADGSYVASHSHMIKVLLGAGNRQKNYKLV